MYYNYDVVVAVDDDDDVEDDEVEDDDVEDVGGETSTHLGQHFHAKMSLTCKQRTCIQAY